MRSFLLLLLISGFPTWAGAATVQMEIAPRIGASAEYMTGQRDKPAVLVLHGFLQTRDFPTVATLARSLNYAGYTVLTPTLSLGIPLRRQSLPCEAIHHHSMDDDIQEIARWVTWLKTHGHRSIVLIGHSFGSLQLLAYLNRQPDKAVKAFIGASLIEAKIGPANRAALIAQMEKRAASPQRALVTHSLSLCKNYRSTPAGLLSYARWDQAHTLAALRNLTVTTLLIMGDADTMVEHNWIKALKHIQVPMAVVPGANHFMDGQHEFDLLDKTLVFLGRLHKVAAR